jgi:hypothetical protein
MSDKRLGAGLLDVRIHVTGTIAVLEGLHDALQDRNLDTPTKLQLIQEFISEDLTRLIIRLQHVDELLGGIESEYLPKAR